MNILYTDAIFDESERDLRASEMGETASSNISCAFLPEPAVKASNPIRIDRNILCIAHN